MRDALSIGQIALGDIDRVEPALSSELIDGIDVSVIRVREEYYIQRVTIPFVHQEIVNEVLPEGERRLSQPGVNGIRELTYHRLFENGIEISNSIVKSSIVKEAVAEIVMVGTKTSYPSISIPGRIVYLSTGNAWMMEGSTANRQLLVSTGDLDGRIFSLSDNGKYLLYTRHSEEAETINSLWIARIGMSSTEMIDLGIANIVHFAAFDPTSSRIAYSTVEWRETAPGWQANNDLNIINISETGQISQPITILEPNSGGMYGWWGSEFAWSPDGMKFLYSRPDEIGMIDIESKSVKAIFSFPPYQTIGDWAWIPATRWSPDGLSIYTISHQLSDETMGTLQPQFDLVAISINNNLQLHLNDNVGMFSSPVPSPVNHLSKYISSLSFGDHSQAAFSIAFTQSSFTQESGTDDYVLNMMDKDGSNGRKIFPTDGNVGFEVQDIVWSPKSLEWGPGYSIALMYHGNVWLINPETGENQQVTGDGLVSRIDWR